MAGENLLAKKLNLAVAELTDVGRKRERNQDNVTHYVPPDDQVLEEKGALFVVCDGMGGHAAGEIAAEVGVNTIRDVYYSTQEADIISGLANAIKSANEAIFSYAREHVEAAGMGTTCVALILNGGRAYFVNIGDSRAYLVRDSHMRQITLDHSWVAEQVRAGLLTEEQARTHAHRNVITRSMGTQSTVNADLFIETLRDGDRILLCSDGLHGYVEEADIEREMLQHRDPDEGTQTLIDMANANGGPDNITAIIVHILEAPPVTDELKIPVAEPGEEQIITQPVPAVTSNKRKPRRPRKQAASGADIGAGPLKPSRATFGSRLATGGLRLMAIAALILLALSIWDFSFGPYAMSRAATTLLENDTSHLVKVAQNSSSQSPSTALLALGSARQSVEKDLQNTHADPQSIVNAQQTLDTQLTPAVQSAVQRYNTAALITSVPSNAISTISLTCSQVNSQAPLALSTISAFVSVAPPANKAPTAQTLYALSGVNLYQIIVPLDTTGAPTNTNITCAQVPLTNVISVVALTSDGSTLYALGQQNNGVYTAFSVVQTGVKNGLPLVKTQGFTVATPNQESPTTIAVSGTTFYIGYKGGKSAGGIWLYTGTAPKAPAQPAITLTQPATALAITNNTLYALLADGSVGQLDVTHTYLPLTVHAAPPLSVADPSAYTASQPVPTPPSDSNTTFPAGATLTVDPALKNNILIADGANKRIVRFTASAQPPALNLTNQYAPGSELSNADHIALSADGTTLRVYAWSGSQLATFTVAEPSPAA